MNSLPDGTPLTLITSHLFLWSTQTFTPTKHKTTTEKIVTFQTRSWANLNIVGVSLIKHGSAQIPFHRRHTNFKAQWSSTQSCSRRRHHLIMCQITFSERLIAKSSILWIGVTSFSSSSFFSLRFDSGGQNVPLINPVRTRLCSSPSIAWPQPPTSIGGSNKHRCCVQEIPYFPFRECMCMYLSARNNHLPIAEHFAKWFDLYFNPRFM